MGCCLCCNSVYPPVGEVLKKIGATDRATGIVTTEKGHPAFLNNAVDEENADRRAVSVKKVILLYNPFSGNGLGNTNSMKLKELLEAKGVEVEMKQSERAKHFMELGKTMDFSGYDVVVVCGGDGTLFETMQGIIERKLETPVAICPGGTGNAFACSLGIFNAEDAAENILAGSSIAVDCNRVKGLKDGEEATHYSINMVGTGLAHDGNEKAEKMRWCGPLRYDCAPLCMLCCNYKSSQSFDLDGVKFETDTIMMFSTLTIAMGSGMKIHPYACLNNGYMDIWIHPVTSIWATMKTQGALKKGTHIFDKNCRQSYLRGKKLSVLDEGHGINIDGENIMRTPCEIECMPQCWRVMYKPKDQPMAVASEPLEEDEKADPDFAGQVPTRRASEL